MHHDGSKKRRVFELALANPDMPTTQLARQAGCAQSWAWTLKRIALTILQEQREREAKRPANA